MGFDPRSVPLSVLDLAPVCEGSDVSAALANSVDLARHAEALGYRRFWLAEHHNMPGIASAATAVLIAHVAAHTSKIRVGAGGIMLPNHSPLQVAEQFGTLAALHPGRIDLGVGRAPGTDHATARALRRYFDSAEQFPQDVQELLRYFEPVQPGQAVQAVPGAGLGVPVWILGSSLFGAQLAAALGLPYAFASHFAPDALEEALLVYHRHFRPSKHCAEPHVMLAVNVVAAATDAEARRLFTTPQQAFVNLRRGRPGLIPPPVDDIEAYWNPQEKAGVERALACSVVGSRDTVAEGLARFVQRHRPDELIVVANLHDHQARLESYRIAAEAWGLAAAG
ncbi:LLM class flavin-dependent oxidoreductase [Pseudoxanthomonas sp. SGNA-20]|uniref:Luciferase-like monooxygenase n=1 Tax=Pseudoxanthomonas taiwanensis J19 TaxID=935569 RepID=A0A562CZK3_9GAMM|nr:MULTISPECIES: LLM class flavin-dependent oxidoreductase [Pseudoxanthomonas]RRN57128.1 LLM class flavin-dependent oxidoreductase [Pseudoxanthomonas sp. SGNA-20]RRN79965.1 LLM class flavin-dependent oxidoreductase [Pseudoxanthomonas sp. SGD-10]TWH02752.1 luciferase family oxidoreductase group 1 [Pseudoxanthomonas taiwanensis J19]